MQHPIAQSFFTFNPSCKMNHTLPSEMLAALATLWPLNVDHPKPYCAPRYFDRFSLLLKTFISFGWNWRQAVRNQEFYKDTAFNLSIIIKLEVISLRAYTSGLQAILSALWTYMIKNIGVLNWVQLAKMC